MYFYKDLFASLCFIFFGAALAFKHPYLYFGAMMCGCFSITAKKKQWSDPIWARLYMEKINEWMDRMEPKKEFSEDEEIRPLPPLDDRKQGKAKGLRQLSFSAQLTAKKVRCFHRTLRTLRPLRSLCRKSAIIGTQYKEANIVQKNNAASVHVKNGSGCFFSEHLTEPAESKAM